MEYGTIVLDTSCGKTPIWLTSIQKYSITLLWPNKDWLKNGVKILVLNNA